MMAKIKKLTKTVFISDIHIPYQDKKALAMAMEVIKDLKLKSEDNIIIGGDLVDYYPISSFSPDLTGSNIDVELFEAVDFLNELRKLAPLSSIYFFEGNHEQRMQKKIMSSVNALAPFLKNRLSIRQLLEFKKFAIKEVKTPFTLNKKLYYLHGHEKKGFVTPKHIANVNLMYYNRNVIVGHHHRFDMSIATQLDGSLLGGWANGCLADLSLLPDGLYSSFDSTQRGITVIYTRDNGFFSVAQHLFVPNKQKGYECLVNGKEYIK
jgi:predicted phosphodiesterase